MIRITVTGEPVAQGRPRFSTVNGFPMTYDSLKNKDWKQYAKMIAAESMMGKPLLEGPLVMQVNVFRGIPSSWSKKKQLQAAEGSLRPIGRPDVDNYVKSAMDALKGVVWVDDSQVVSLTAYKFYSKTPRIDLSVCCVTDDPYDGQSQTH